MSQVPPAAHLRWHFRRSGRPPPCAFPGREWEDLVSYEGPTLVDEARRAVAVLVQHINDEAGPVVASLLANAA
ncbi:hypothetical protein [Streptomyces sp. NPDC004721]